jgi:hypothetical protein
MNNKTIIIGSYAISHHFSDYNRTPSDIDYVVRGQQTIFIDELSKRQEIHHGNHFDYLLDNNKDSFFADPDMVYTIKVSHLAWDINFDKHMKDVIFLKSKGCKLILEFYKTLYNHWQIVHGSKSYINLSRPVSKFFHDTISRKYDHDSLHELVAFYDRPLHEKIRKSVDNALPSQTKWNELSHEDKIKCSLEEIYVIFLERYSNFPISHGIVKAMKQLITSMTKGYFNLFLIENFEELRTYDKTHLKLKMEQL